MKPRAAGTPKAPRGRPRRQEGMERIAVFIPGELKRWLQHRAIDIGKDMGQLVTEAVEAYRAKKK